jgi:hypothetical protein
LEGTEIEVAVVIAALEEPAIKEGTVALESVGEMFDPAPSTVSPAGTWLKRM